MAGKSVTATLLGQFPRFSQYDPGAVGEGSLDPLGFGAVADRIADRLAQREKKRIEVYEPYLAGTHDEKMFRVVKDRAGWFDIVMGRATGEDERATDVEEMRVSLHPRIREALSMDLTSRSYKPIRV